MVLMILSALGTVDLRIEVGVSEIDTFMPVAQAPSAKALRMNTRSPLCTLER